MTGAATGEAPGVKPVDVGYDDWGNEDAAEGG